MIEEPLIRGIRISILWALLLSAILVNSLLSKPALSMLDIILLAIVSFWAGLILIDFGSIIIGWFMAFIICIPIMFFELSLPAFLGVLSYPGLNEIIYFQAVKMIFTAVFPSPIIVGVVSSVLGGYFAERFLASA